MAILKIYPENIKKNSEYLCGLCSSSGIDVAVVTKVTCGDPMLAQKAIEGGAKYVADSRIENIKKLRKAGINNPALLLRTPSLKRLDEALDNIQMFLVSELKTVEAIAEVAKNKGVKPSLIYMIDTGDLREGVWYSEALEEITRVVKISNGLVNGLGTNLGCYGGIVATPDKFEMILSVGKKAEALTGQKMKIYTGGNTASLPLVEENNCPQGINLFRLGESIMCGTDATNNRIVPGTTTDTFIIGGEVIELKVKPSLPEGEIGRDSFGRKPVFEDRGNRLRAILSLGEQDVLPAGLIPQEKGIEVLHASSDHLILDVTDYSGALNVGDMVWFKQSYGCLLRSTTSPYVVKEYE